MSFNPCAKRLSLAHHRKLREWGHYQGWLRGAITAGWLRKSDVKPYAKRSVSVQKKHLLRLFNKRYKLHKQGKFKPTPLSYDQILKLKL